MYDFDDFNKDPSYYENLIPDPSDLAEFTSSLMLVTHMLKNLDDTDSVKSGHEFMMKIFNMSGLEGTEEDEPALNVIMCLLSHVVALLTTAPSKEEYFKYFDNTVIYPMMKIGEENGMD